jgi:hypothetical protein
MGKICKSITVDTEVDFVINEHELDNLIFDAIWEYKQDQKDFANEDDLKNHLVKYIVKHVDEDLIDIY